MEIAYFHIANYVAGNPRGAAYRFATVSSRPTKRAADEISGDKAGPIHFGKR